MSEDGPGAITGLGCHRDICDVERGMYDIAPGVSREITAGSVARGYDDSGDTGSGTILRGLDGSDGSSIHSYRGEGSFSL